MYRSTGNASSMHVWLAGFPDILLPLECKIQIRSLVCTLRNSKFAITSIVCTLRNSKCAFRIKIQNTHFAVVWKQSLFHFIPIVTFPFFIMTRYVVETWNISQLKTLMSLECQICVKGKTEFMQCAIMDCISISFNHSFVVIPFWQIAKE